MLITIAAHSWRPVSFHPQLTTRIASFMAHHPKFWIFRTLMLLCLPTPAPVIPPSLSSRTSIGYLFHSAFSWKFFIYKALHHQALFICQRGAPPPHSHQQPILLWSQPPIPTTQSQAPDSGVREPSSYLPPSSRTPMPPTHLRQCWSIPVEPFYTLSFHVLIVLLFSCFWNLPIIMECLF